MLYCESACVNHINTCKTEKVYVCQCRRGIGSFDNHIGARKSAIS